MFILFGVVLVGLIIGIAGVKRANMLGSEEIFSTLIVLPNYENKCEILNVRPPKWVFPLKKSVKVNVKLKMLIKYGDNGRQIDNKEEIIRKLEQIKADLKSKSGLEFKSIVYNTHESGFSDLASRVIAAVNQHNKQM